jgi:hypothetical protein
MPPVVDVTINGIRQQVAVGSDVLATDGDDTLDLGDFSWIGHTRLFGGDGDDVFSGYGGDRYGGDGNDWFYNSGVEPNFVPKTGPSIIDGGRGNDRMFDAYGSADYYGGKGSDLFSTMQQNRGYAGLSHSYPGDIDRVWLGEGKDTAIVRFYEVSDRTGIHLEDRIVNLDGGTGIDRLVVFSTVFAGNVAPGVMDFTRAGDGVISMPDFTATGFESFDLRIGLGLVSMIRTGAYSDRIQILGSLVENAGYPHDYTINAGGGDDRVIGYLGKTNEHIYGKLGNDVLISGGTYPGGRDYLFGGGGDDILVSSAFTVAHLFVTMQGDAGRDLFVIDRGYGQDQIISDFAQGEDLIVFNGNVWNYNLDTPAAVIREGLHGAADWTVLADNSSVLEFRHVLYAQGGQNYYYSVRYDRNSGEIFTGGNAFNGEVRMGSVVGAPDLTLEDFAFL